MSPRTLLSENTPVSLGVVLLILASMVAGAHYTGRLVEGVARDRTENYEWRKATTHLMERMQDQLNVLTDLSRDNKRRLDGIGVPAASKERK